MPCWTDSGASMLSCQYRAVDSSCGSTPASVDAEGDCKVGDEGVDQGLNSRRRQPGQGGGDDKGPGREVVGVPVLEECGQALDLHRVAAVRHLAVCSALLAAWAGQNHTGCSCQSCLRAQQVMADGVLENLAAQMSCKAQQTPEHPAAHSATQALNTWQPAR